MRGYIGSSHVGVSARVPGPTAAMGFLGFLFTLPLWIVIIVLWGITIGIYLVACLAVVLWWIVKIVFFPVTLVARHRRKVRDRKALLRVQRRNLMPTEQTPAPLPPPQFGSTRG